MTKETKAEKENEYSGYKGEQLFHLANCYPGTYIQGLTIKTGPVISIKDILGQIANAAFQILLKPSWGFLITLYRETSKVRCSL